MNTPLYKSKYYSKEKANSYLQIYKFKNICSRGWLCSETHKTGSIDPNIESKTQPKKVKTFIRAAHKLADVHDFDKAISHFESAIKLLEKVDIIDGDYLRVSENMARLYKINKCYMHQQKAQNTRAHALIMFDSLSQSEVCLDWYEDLFFVIIGLSPDYGHASHDYPKLYQTAFDYYQFADEIGFKPIDPLVMYSRYALFCERYRKYDEAVSWWWKILSIQKVTIKSWAKLETIETLNKIAELYELQGKHIQAEMLLINCVQLTKQLFGTKNERLARALNKLAFTSSKTIPKQLRHRRGDGPYLCHEMSYEIMNKADEIFRKLKMYDRVGLRAGMQDQRQNFWWHSRTDEKLTNIR